MKEVIAMHGWSSDSKSWFSWEESFLTNGWVWTSAERGYTSTTAIEPCWSKYSKTRVVICHSLGIHLIDKSVLSKATHIVLINCFGRFIPIAGRERRSLQIGLKGMQKALETENKNEMLELFWEKANSPNLMQNFKPQVLYKKLSMKGEKKLKTDLELLINTEKLPCDINRNARALVIDGEKDKIVIGSVKHQLFEELSSKLNVKPKHWVLPNQGHLILMQEIINNTRLWLEALK